MWRAGVPKWSHTHRGAIRGARVYHNVTRANNNRIGLGARDLIEESAHASAIGNRFGAYNGGAFTVHTAHSTYANLMYYTIFIYKKNKKMCTRSVVCTIGN